MTPPLLAVAASGFTTTPPATTPPLPPETEPPSSSEYPPADEITSALRLAGRLLATRKVGITGSTDASVNAAFAAAKPIQDRNAGGNNLTDEVGPDHRVDVLLGEGPFLEASGSNGFLNVIGVGVGRAVMETSSQSADGVLHPYGAVHYERLHLRPITNPADRSAPKYCVHIGGGAVTSLADCVLDLSGIQPDTLTGSAGIAGWLGADGIPGQWIIMHKCEFIRGPLANGFNLHGHSVTVFSSCTGLDDVEIGVPSTGTMYVINTPCAGVKGLAGDHIYITPGTTVLPGNAATIHESTTWPVPATAAKGLPPVAAQRYYPSDLGRAKDYSTPITATAPMALTPGRRYITRVKLTSANRIVKAGFTAVEAGGKYRMLAQPADTLYVRDNPADPAMGSTGSWTPITAGGALWTQAGFSVFTRYPGDHGFWVALEVDVATTVLGSTDLPGLTDCFVVDDNTTLTRVPAGAAFPVLTLRADGT